MSEKSLRGLIDEFYKLKKLFYKSRCCNQSGGDGIQSIQEGDNITVDNTDPLNPIVSSTGGELEKITEGANTGYALKGRTAANYGNIGQHALDFSVSNSASSTRGATGTRSVNFGLNNTISGLESGGIGSSLINPYIRTLAIGSGLTGQSTNSQSNANIIISDGPLTTYNNLYGNIICGYESSVGTQGATLNDSVIYGSVISGRHLNVYAAKHSLVVGNALVGGAARCAIVGSANVDLTQTTATQLTSTGQAYNPRFIVGVGNWNESSNTGTRANGFVVMSDGKVSAPEQTISHINTIGAKALTTKEYVDRKEIKTISATTYTLLETDNNKILQFTSATDVTITIPTGLTLGNRFEGKQRGDGQLIFVGASGVTVNVGASETNKTLERFSVWGLDCVATDEYDLFGKLELA